jgi:hypothetical protein
MRDAHRVISNEEFTLVAVHRGEIEKDFISIAERPGPEVVSLTRLGSEVGESEYAGQSLDVRLPVSAKMVLAGVDRE